MKAAPTTYTGILFSFPDVHVECGSFADFAQGFLDPTTVHVLKKAAADLETIRALPVGKRTRWQIPSKTPLRTRVSNGEYQPNQKSGRRIQAEISFVWEIEPVAPKKRGAVKHFVLNGLASTKVSFLEHRDNDKPICRWAWTVDVGEAVSPGTHFHAQVKEWHERDIDDHAAKGFCAPSTLDVPRIPTLPLSPFGVVELVIAELFQDKWEREKRAASGGVNEMWRALQKRRLLAYLDWQTELLKQLHDGTPLLRLKLGKPPENVLGESRQ